MVGVALGTGVAVALERDTGRPTVGTGADVEGRGVIRGRGVAVAASGARVSGRWMVGVAAGRCPPGVERGGEPPSRIVGATGFGVRMIGG